MTLVVDKIFRNALLVVVQCNRLLKYTIVHKNINITYIKNMQRIIFSTGYNYNYINNQSREIIFTIASVSHGKRINYNYINNWNYLRNDFVDHGNVLQERRL